MTKLVVANAGSKPTARLIRMIPSGGSLPDATFWRRHRMIVGLIWAHVVGLFTFGLLRGFSAAQTALVVAPIALLATGASWPAFGGRRLRPALAALALPMSSAALVYLWNGTIEAHFHFFVMLAVASLYLDWMPYLVAIGFVLVHHGVVGALMPDHVFSNSAAVANPWAWAAIHAGFVAAGCLATIASWGHHEAARAEADARAHEHAGLRRVAEAVAADNDQDALFALVAAEISDQFGVETGVVGRYQGTNVQLVGVRGSVGPPAGTILPLSGDSPLAVVHRTGRPHRAGEDIAAVMYRGSVSQPGRRWETVAAPVFVVGRLWGGITVATDRASGLPGGAEQRLADFARLIGLSIGNAEARAELEARASTDPLTGLANHRTFHERLHAEVERAHRHGRELALVTLDIDHFKRVNDTFGHPTGDAVIVELAARLRATARPGDLVARVGGEEFVWILPETSGVTAWEAAERLRQVVRGVAFDVAGTITISAGVSDIAQAGTPNELLRLADQALYWAKRNGRDITFIYSPDVSECLESEEQGSRVAQTRTFQSLRAIAQTTDAKHPSTDHHSERVAQLAVAIATEAGWVPERRVQLRDAALLHDIGKVTVPDDLMLSARPLTLDEYLRVQAHAELGAQIASEVLSAEAAGWVRGHHERVDGGGYPNGLRGDMIPDGAKILALAEAWDAMTSDRPYAPARGVEEALRECEDQAGRHFAPQLVAILKRLLACGALAPINGAWRSAVTGEPVIDGGAEPPPTTGSHRAVDPAQRGPR